MEPLQQATFLIVYRNSEDDVNFIEITPITYRLLEIIQEHEKPLAEACLKQVARESNHSDSERIVAGGLQILKELAEKTIITVVGHRFIADDNFSPHQRQAAF